MKNRLTISLLTLLLVAASCASRKKVVQPPQNQAFEWMTANINIQAEGNGVVFQSLTYQKD